MNENVAVYVNKPRNRRSQGFLLSLVKSFGNIRDNKDLLWVLFKRDYLAGFRRSFLGLLWIVISPVIGIVSWLLLHFAGVLKTGESTVPYPVFLLIGASYWGVFVSTYSTTAESVNSGGGLLSQIDFPYEILVVKQLLQVLIPTAVSLLFSFVLASLYGTSDIFAKLLIWPMLLPLALFGIALGNFISVVGVVFQDLRKLFDFGIHFLMFATPVLYTKEVASPILQKIVNLNPLTYLVNTPRHMLVTGEIIDMTEFAWVVVIALVTFVVSVWFFYSNIKTVIERAQ